MQVPLHVSAVGLAVTVALAASSCGGGQRSVATAAPSSTAVPRRDPRQRYSISTTVLENRDHGPGPEVFAGLRGIVVVHI